MSSVAVFARVMKNPLEGVKGHGKRGGVRVIYYWWISKDRISLTFIYPKNEMDDFKQIS